MLINFSSHDIVKRNQRILIIFQGFYYFYIIIFFDFFHFPKPKFRLSEYIIFLLFTNKISIFICIIYKNRSSCNVLPTEYYNPNSLTNIKLFTYLYKLYKHDYDYWILGVKIARVDPITKKIAKLATILSKLIFESETDFKYLYESVSSRYT